MAHRLLKNNGFAPAWIEKAKDIEAESNYLRAQAPVQPRDLQTRVDALNRRIVAFNLKVPALSLQKRLFEISR
jgi:hypothetical protein